MGMKSKIKTQLRLNSFNPKDCNRWSDFFRSGSLAEKSGSMFRFYFDASDTSPLVRTWTADVWDLENSHRFSMPLSSWAGRYGLTDLKNLINKSQVANSPTEIKQWTH